MSPRVPTLALDGVSFSADSIEFSDGLDYGQNDSYIRVLILTWSKLLLDSPLKSEEKPARVIRRFIGFLASHHIKDVVSDYSKLAHDIVSNDYMTGPEASIRPYVKQMEKTPIFREYLHYQRTGCPETLRYILTFLRFAKKCRYVDEDFDTVALRDWWDVEERISSIVLDEKLMSSLKNVLSIVLEPLNDNFLAIRSGPGKVAERGIDHIYDKLNTLAWDENLLRVFRTNRFGLVQADGITTVPTSVGDVRRVSRLKFVPKDLSKSRAICMEPSAYMFVQQEVKRWMYDALASGITSKFIHLDDQSVNRQAALHGSATGSMDTIDLSSASDSVHVDLVRGIFPPQWLYYMLGTRTSKVDVPDRREPVEVAKFAPMGSAVCFPTQCAVFLAICLESYAAHYLGIESGSRVISINEFRSFLRNGLTHDRNVAAAYTRKLQPPLIYGDDIICDSRVTDSVISALTRCGFSVNEQKSFTGSQTFRESCGVFAVSGNDVTPFHYKLPFFRNYRLQADSFASIIESINNLNALGYHATASFLRNWLKQAFSFGRLPYVEDSDEFGILTRHKHAVPSAFTRVNADWQILEERVLGLKPRKLKGLKRPENLEEYSYGLWQRGKVRESITPPSGKATRIRPQETRVVAIWSPLRTE